MMNEYLLFRLYGPMASWGDTAVGEYRPSYKHPSRTAVLGLVAAALGIGRDEEDRLLGLDRDYRMAVRVERGGELLRDYHTTQVPPQQRGIRHRSRRDELAADKLNTILSQRDYRTDAANSIALQPVCAEPRHGLLQMAQALRRPRFPLYLGRKSCPPALPLDAKVLHAQGLGDAFAQYPSCLEQLTVLLSGAGHTAYHARQMLTPQAMDYC